MAPRHVGTLFALGGIWGASFLFIKVIVEDTSPLELVAGRLVFGTVAVFAVMALRRLPVRYGPSLIAKVGGLAALALIAPFALIAWAETHIDSGIASVLNSTMPLFTALFAAAILSDEKFTLPRLAGLGLGFLGVVTLTGGDIVDVTDNNVLGQLAVVGAAACYGLGAVYSRTLLRSEDPLSLSALQLLAGSVLAVVLLFAAGGTPDYSISVEAWLSLLALGILGTGLGLVAYIWLIDHVGSVRSSLVTYIVPVVGLFLGWAVLDEGIGVNTIIGALLIIVGVASVVRGRGPSANRRVAPVPID
jgi:drug/metabolite transporter (DMT)-like permease